MCERISRLPNAQHCPVCATDFTGTPGVDCPACRRAFAPRTVLSNESNLRLGIERFRFDGPAWFAGGLMAAFGISNLLISMGRLGIVLGVVLFVPAFLRTRRLFPPTRTDPAFFLFTTFVAALGVTILMAGVAVVAGFIVIMILERNWAWFAGTAAAVGFGTFCITITATGRGFHDQEIRLIVGGFVGVGLFGLIYAQLWPRESEYDKIRRPPDPEE